jgi:hypothetical protein
MAAFSPHSDPSILAVAVRAVRLRTTRRSTVCSCTEGSLRPPAKVRVFACLRACGPFACLSTRACSVVCSLLSRRVRRCFLPFLTLSCPANWQTWATSSCSKSPPPRESLMSRYVARSSSLTLLLFSPQLELDRRHEHAQCRAQSGHRAFHERHGSC